MKKSIFLVFGLIIFSSVLFADIDTKDGSAITTTSNMDGSSDTHDVADGQTVAGGGSPISDDFSGDLSKWTVLVGSAWSIAGGVMSSPASAGVNIYTDAQTSTITQILQAKWVTVANYNGFYFRSQNNGSTYAYSFRYSSGGNWEWRYCGGADHSNVASSCTTIQGDSASSGTLFSPDAGDYVTIKADGTGDGIVISAWDCGASPCDLGSLGAENFTMTDDPSTAGCEAAPDTGKNVGTYNGDTASQDFDDFEAE